MCPLIQFPLLFPAALAKPSPPQVQTVERDTSWLKDWLKVGPWETLALGPQAFNEQCWFS